MNWIDAAIVAVVVLLVGGAIGYLIYRRRSGKNCGCGCNGCPYHQSCEHVGIKLKK